MKRRLILLLIIPFLFACSPSTSSEPVESQTVFVEFGVNVQEVVPSENSSFESAKIENRIFPPRHFIHIAFRFYWSTATTDNKKPVEVNAHFPKRTKLLMFFQHGKQAPRMSEDDESKHYTFFLVPNVMNIYVFTLLPNEEIDYYISLSSDYKLTGKGTEMPVIKVRNA